MAFILRTSYKSNTRIRMELYIYSHNIKIISRTFALDKVIDTIIHLSQTLVFEVDDKAGHPEGFKGVLISKDEVSKLLLLVVLLPTLTSLLEELQLVLGTKAGDYTFMTFCYFMF